MANIIIPPKHQSAPKTPSLPQAIKFDHRTAQGKFAKRGTPLDDLDLPEYHDPKIQAEIAEFEKNVMSVSPEETVEEAMRQYELNYARAAAQRWKGQERWQGRENEEMRLVHIYHPHTFIDKLRAVGINAVRHYIPANDAEETDPRRAMDAPLIWLNELSRLGRLGVNAWVKDEELGRMVARTVTTLQYPYGPEWSIMRFDRYNVPTNEKYRGWRTVLLALIFAGVITEEQADLAFGKAYGPASDFYREQLFNHRQSRMGLVV